MPNSQEFNDLGDQWLISYMYSISGMVLPTLFTIGHCLEAYCKSALLKHDPSLNIYGRKYGHDVEGMIGEIKQKVGILNNVEFLPNVEQRFMIGGPIPFNDQLMSDPEYLHYVQNQELYWVAKYQKDLKYIGTSGEKMPKQFGILVMMRNPYWIPLGFKFQVQRLI